MPTTNQKLQMSTQDYENMLLGSYVRWCESVTVDAREYQKVFANAKINKWYIAEYAKCETEFNLLTQRYEKSITTDDLKRCYNNCTYKMFNQKPSILIQEITTTSTIDSLKFYGTKNSSLTFNLN
ncbi:hypothetical protein OIU80_05500 [Flavobacterium sp. LS1R47]|uniref:Uncharacterized protein n=1 Tax=Flavobacterium frigoritolerans TaxID=2987686 RepID=A0A9X2ZNC2_9FLAO|nr:hypothetical protein [Flavobacterium frigoritolerans]MCV9931731.1 hypothetical protein [Flavobacterium frigoritolerans]